MDYQEQYNELREYVDTIIATSKLIGHKVFTSESKNSIYIKKQNSVSPLMKITIIPTKDSPTLKTFYRGKHRTFQYLPHQPKIDHLKNLLENL